MISNRYGNKVLSVFSVLILQIIIQLFPSICHASPDIAIQFTGKLDKDYISDKIAYFEDTSNTLSVYDVQNLEFTPSDAKVLNLGVKPSTYWLKLTIHNVSRLENLILLLDNPMLTEVVLYQPTDSSHGDFLEESVSKYQPFRIRKNYNPSSEFHLTQPKGSTVTYFIKVNSLTQLLIPVKLGTNDTIGLDEANKNVWYGLYFGIMLVMFFYNLFIFLSIWDRSYLYYISYILSVVLVQLNVTGLGFKYLWSAYPSFEIYSTYIFSALTAITSIGFIRRFLHTKRHVPRAHKFFWVFVIAYVITTLNVFFGDKYLSYNLLNANALPLSLFMIGVAIYIGKKYKYRPATFFLISWTIFLAGIIVYVLKDFSVIPYNMYTVSAVQIGSAVEVILLSFALADKINILQAETRKSQEQALMATQENARIIREQNIILEQNVKARTEELQRSNEDLAETLTELKEAQSQLVESEKMASLGQLTAGIAHEINNPINFVTSNVNPLKRDVTILLDLIQQMEVTAVKELPVAEKTQLIAAIKTEADYEYLCTEIDYLLKGIGEGASRTAEIVKGLRVFSRLDEDDLKLANLNEGLDSTIVILNHLLGNAITVSRDYAEIPLVECYPGKLNQVFLNMMSNAIHAITERWRNEEGGTLKITTSSDEKYAYIRIADNGSGMDDETKKKLFEPFFTTKGVGEGTGLGLSIAYNTIKKHNGFIELQSTPGEGTEFTIVIPLEHEVNSLQFSA